MESKPEHELLYTVLGIINITFSSLVVITYFTSKKLQQHPSGVIASLAICELATTYHSLIYMWGTQGVLTALTLPKMRLWTWFGLDENGASGLMCIFNQSIFIFGTIAGILYNIILCIDLILTLRNPFSPAFKRKILYHIFSLTTALAITIPLSSINSLAACYMDTDFSQDKKKLQVINTSYVAYLILIYCVIGIFSIIYAMSRVYSGVKLSNAAMKKYLTRHILYVSVYVVCWGSTIVSYVFSKYFKRNEVVDEIVMFLISVSGVTLSIIRFSNPAVFNKVITGKTFSFESGENETDEWKVSLYSILGEINTELASNIFDALYSVYSKKDILVEKEVTDQMCKFEKLHSGKRCSRLAESLKLENQTVHSELVEYSPVAFDFIRNKCGITNRMMMDSTDPAKNIDSCVSANESQGKSGSFFIFSSDKSLVMKTIKEKEVKVLRKILKRYAEHLEKHPKSLLCRIYGMFNLKLPGISPVYIIVMSNLLKGHKPDLLFDLKGSTLGRASKVKNSRNLDNKSDSGPLKDLDFIRNKFKIPLETSSYQEIAEIIMADANFLKSFKLMDYSLLLSVEKINGEFIFTFGIIDFLIEYNFFKKVERAFAVLTNPKSSSAASVINPEKYAERFTDFLLKIVFQKKNQILDD